MAARNGSPAARTASLDCHYDHTCRTLPASVGNFQAPCWVGSLGCLQVLAASSPLAEACLAGRPAANTRRSRKNGGHTMCCCVASERTRVGCAEVLTAFGRCAEGTLYQASSGGWQPELPSPRALTTSFFLLLPHLPASSVVHSSPSRRRIITAFIMDFPNDAKPDMSAADGADNDHPPPAAAPTPDRVDYDTAAPGTAATPPKRMGSSPPPSPADVSRASVWNSSGCRSGEETPAVGSMVRKISGCGTQRPAPEGGNLHFMERQVRHRMRKAVGSVAGLVIDEVGIGESEDEDAFVTPQLAPTLSARKSRSTSQAPGARGRTTSAAPRAGARCRSVSIAVRNGTGGSLFGDNGGGRGFGAAAAASAAANSLGAVAEDNEAGDEDDEGGQESRIFKPEYHRFSRVSAATGDCSRPKRRSTVSMVPADAAVRDIPKRRSTMTLGAGQAAP